MPGLKSRNKGKRGEREFAAWLRGWSKAGEPVEATRGAQHHGGPNSPDVVCSIPGWHLEVCLDVTCDIGTETLRAKMVQAFDDCPTGMSAAVAWHPPRKEWRISLYDELRSGWIVTLAASDWMRSVGYQRQPIEPIGERVFP